MIRDSAFDVFSDRPAPYAPKFYKCHKFLS